MLLYMAMCFILSSPYLCVFDDDHVTCYMGTYVVAGEHVDAQSWRGASVGDFHGFIFVMFL